MAVAHGCQVPEPRPLEKALDYADEFIAALGATVNHGSSRAAYAPIADLIVLPEREMFESDAHYIATSSSRAWALDGTREALESRSARTVR